MIAFSPHNIKVAFPIECLVKEFFEFIDIVRGGNQNINEGLSKRVKGAYLLGFYYIENKIVSISAIKKPTTSYIEYIFSKAGLGVPDTILEKGWTYTLPEYRRQGLGLRLGLELIRKADSDLYATVRRDNGNIPKLLLRQGFIQEGKPFIGQMGKEILLFVRRKK